MTGCDPIRLREATCPACGKENPEGFQFCGFCTAPLTEQPAATLLEER